MEHESIPHWQERLVVSIGLKTQEVLEKFLLWQEGKKTCERCGGEEYFDFCPVRFVCRAAMTLGEEVEDDDGRSQGKSTDKRGKLSEGSGSVEASFVEVP